MNFDKPLRPGQEDSPKKNPSGLNRRDLIRGGIAAGGIAGVIGLTKAIEHSLLEKEEMLSEEQQNAIEQDKESFEREYSPRFADEMRGYAVFYSELGFDEALFVDELGRPIGEPVAIADFQGISPGERDAHGVITGRLSQEWLDAVRQDVCRRYGIRYDATRDLPRQMNLIAVARELVESLADEGLIADTDPTLTQEKGVASGSSTSETPSKTVVSTYLDIVQFMGSQPVHDAPDQSRLEYLREKGMGLSQRVPAAAWNEILFVLPGLAAQESKYVNDAVSSTGAKGIMQFMPDTWETLKDGEIDDVLNFADQVAATGKLFDGKYTYLLDHAREELQQIKEQFFGGDTKLFEHYFLAPVLINSYNSGEGRLEKCIKVFLETYPTYKSWTEKFGGYSGGVGYDLYLSMTKFCSQVVAREKDGDEILRIPGYGRDSSQYVIRAYTLAELLKEKGWF